MKDFERIEHTHLSAIRAKAHIIESLGIMADKVIWTSELVGELNVPMLLKVSVVVGSSYYMVKATGAMAPVVMAEIRKMV